MPSPPTQPHTPTQSSNPFNDDSSTPRPGNLFYSQSPNTPSPIARRDDRTITLAHMAASSSRLYPNTEAGHEQYAKDLTAWETAYSGATQMTFTKDHLPLTPGTVALGSQECYVCGQNGHTGRDCKALTSTQINQRERSWRIYITKILFPVGNRATVQRQSPASSSPYANIAQMNAYDTESPVYYDPYIYPIDNVQFHEESQGNGQESCE